MNEAIATMLWQAMVPWSFKYQHLQLNRAFFIWIHLYYFRLQVSGNLNGPVIALAEKAADIIRGRPPLPKSTAPVYKPKTLETQR